MRQLIVFGCSFVTGYNLKDPNKAWPIQLGNMLDYTVCNNGDVGVSNLKILTNILRYFKDNKATPSDVVVIMWTIPTRDLIFNADKSLWRDINPYDTDETVKHWASAHNDVDLQYRSWLYIQHASLFLASHNVPHYNFIPRSELLDCKPAFVDVKVVYPQFVELIDIHGSVDGFHPNEIAHREIAAVILNNIKETV